MLYKTYKNQDLEIGSWAIESAHRTIIQQRAKTIRAALDNGWGQSILSLPSIYHSGRWQELFKLNQG